MSRKKKTLLLYHFLSNWTFLTKLTLAIWIFHNLSILSQKSHVLIDEISRLNEGNNSDLHKDDYALLISFGN